MNYQFFNKFRSIKLNKKYLPLFLLVFGVVVFSSVAVNQRYLGKKAEKNEEATYQQNISSSEKNGTGEVAGVQEESGVESSPTPTLSKKQTTPTNKPEVKSDSNQQSNNNSNSNSNSNSSNTTTVIVVTATPAPTNTPIPTNTPTPIPPTPTPDNSPFDASISCNYSGSNVSYEIQANKLITSCSGDWSRGCMIEPNGGCICNGSTCSSFCNNASGQPASIVLTIGSSSGETKQLSCNP